MNSTTWTREIRKAAVYVRGLPEFKKAEEDKWVEMIETFSHDFTPFERARLAKILWFLWKH